MKNECSRNFKFRVYRTYRKRDIGEYSRTFCDIVNFVRQTPLLVENIHTGKRDLTLSFEYCDSDCLQVSLGYLTPVLDCYCLKCYVDCRNYYLCVQFPVESAEQRHCKLQLPNLFSGISSVNKSSLI